MSLRLHSTYWSRRSLGPVQKSRVGKLDFVSQWEEGQGFATMCNLSGSALLFFWPSFLLCVCMCAKSLQLYLTLCNPMDCSPPGSLVHGILQARYWSGLPCPSPGVLPHPRIESLSPASPALQAGSLPTEPPGRPQRPACLPLNHGRAASLHSSCALQLSESRWPTASRAVLWVAVWLLVPASL